ncbi:MAG TPA: DinB family protein [Bryobacteraceae bacterium]|nr:DinB family protein [Bryobacteraceae bacterium]
MSEINRIVDQLHRAWEGPAWHGPALGELLAGVMADTAAQHSIPGAHTIWEIVLHVTVWISVVARRIEGQSIPTLPPAEDWPAAPEPSEAGWRDAINLLAEAQRDLEDKARQLPDDRLREKVLGDRPYSIYTMLHGVVQHNLYHAGQIALLKKAALAP